MSLMSLRYAYYTLGRSRRVQVCFAIANYIYVNAMRRGLLDLVPQVDWIEAAFSDVYLASLDNDEEIEARTALLSDEEFKLIWPILECLNVIYQQEAKGVYPPEPTFYNIKQAVLLLEPDAKASENIIASLMGVES